LATAFNWAPLRAVPDVMAGNGGHETTGAALFTVRSTVAVALVKAFVSAGVKTADRLRTPAFKIVPVAVV
jgi:hypothetical protein